MHLFHDDKDRYKYMDILRDAKEKHNFALHAYCLMTNHVHLLMEERDSAVSDVMKSIGVSYSMYYNKKNDRIGSVNQDRFRSEAVESENQFLLCARYIHNNPVKAGMVDCPKDYSWSSYPVYLGLASDNVLNNDFLMGYYQDLSALKDFTSALNEDRFMDYDQEDTPDKNEEAAILSLQEELWENWGLKLSDINNLKKSKRKLVIKQIKANTNLSYRKLAEVMKVSKDVIYRA